MLSVVVEWKEVLEKDPTAGISEDGGEVAILPSDFETIRTLLFLLILLALVLLLASLFVGMLAEADADKRSVLADVICNGKIFSGELELHELFSSLELSGESSGSRLKVAGGGVLGLGVLTCDSDRVCTVRTLDGTRTLPSNAHAPSENPDDDEESLSAGSGEVLMPISFGVENASRSSLGALLLKAESKMSSQSSRSRSGVRVPVVGLVRFCFSV